MLLKLGDERLREGDGAQSGLTLRWSFDHLARGQAEPLASDGDGSTDQVDVRSAEGEQLAASEPGQPGCQDERSVSLGHGGGEVVELAERGELLLRMGLGAAAVDAARVLGDPVIVDGLAQDLVQPGVGLRR
ncbi:MAG: hypothetical protein M3063_16085 [Actinomycetota bacterium]|nr:hypothetical protein [Actinomycetota bacterium]